MKRRLVLFSCALALTVAAPFASASSEIPFFHRHPKKAAQSTEAPAPAPKPKRSILHRSKRTREEAARSEAAFGMPGPRSVGWRHPEPGPAGVGAK